MNQINESLLSALKQVTNELIRINREKGNLVYTAIERNAITAINNAEDRKESHWTVNGSLSSGM